MVVDSVDDLHNLPEHDIKTHRWNWAVDIAFTHAVLLLDEAKAFATMQPTSAMVPVCVRVCVCVCVRVSVRASVYVRALSTHFQVHQPQLKPEALVLGALTEVLTRTLPTRLRQVLDLLESWYMEWSVV